MLLHKTMDQELDHELTKIESFICKAIVGYYAIYLFISHRTFYFRVNIVFPPEFDLMLGISLLTCECGHWSNTSNTLFVRKSMNNYTWHHKKYHVCLCSREWAQCMEIVMLHFYIRSFITSRSLHDSWGPSLCCPCDGYEPNMRNNGYKCH
jgi:hypothetical protein